MEEDDATRIFFAFYGAQFSVKVEIKKNQEDGDEAEEPSSYPLTKHRRSKKED